MTTTESLLLRKLRDALGDEAVIEDDGERALLAEDALGRRGGDEGAAMPVAVVRPRSASDVARALSLAAKAGTPVVAYGAGTGLMGGARTTTPGIVLDTSALRSIEVLPADRIVWAGAGVVLEAVDVVLRAHGLCLGHDPWTYPVATVGGAISTNGLGYKGGRYGGMGDQVLALEVALTDGTLLRTRSVARRSTGPDLARLFIAAEGTLGVITGAALRAYRVPEVEALGCFGFQTFESGFAAVDEMSALGLRPSLLDYGEEHASPWPELSARDEEPPVLYLGFEGFREEVEASWTRARRVIASHGGDERPVEEASRFWTSRHVVAERFARERRNERRSSGWGADLAMDYIHVALPPSTVPDYRWACHDETSAAGVGLFECGLWTGPELFSAVLGYPHASGGQKTLKSVIDRLLATAQDLGGSMEYCHGAGVRLAGLMEREHGVGLEVMRRLKHALDPGGVLNPGKLGL